MPAAAQYSENAARYAALRDELARISARISRLRLATFLPAAACLVWLLSRGFTPILTAIMVVLFVAFGVLVAWHAQVEERLAWYEALRVVNVRGVARVLRDWKSLPSAEPPAGLDLSGHPYALDLDAFGRASLYQWLGPAATAQGGIELARWLLTPADGKEIEARQHAAAELAPAAEWRDQFGAHGVLAGGIGQPRMDRFLEWVEGPDSLGRHAALIRAAVLLILGSIWLLIGLHATGVIASAHWLTPMLAGIILSFALAGRITSAFDSAGGGQLALRAYAGLFDHASLAPASSPRLSEIRRRLSVGGKVAALCMRQLNNILGFADLRRGAAIFHFPIQALTLWDFHVYFALEKWRRSAGPHVRDWLDALSSLDALTLVAAVRHDNPGWCLPQIGEAPVLDAVALGHPLIADDRRVANDTIVGPPGTLLLVTGSNMSGKSTLLRAIGLNTVLAQAGAAVCAERFSMPQVDLQTSIRVQDSLELGLSYFMAALARLKGVVDAAEHEREGRVLLYLLDEILQGTNSAERGIAVRAVARHLIDAGAIGAMTTHDLNLASEEPLNTAARLVHFTEIVDEHGEMRFDYRLRPGLASSRNALRLMQMIGIDL
jgi:MutS domain V